MPGRGKRRGAAGAGAMPQPGAPSVAQVTQDLNKLKVVPSQNADLASAVIPAKTAPGTKGRRVELTTNMWELQLPENTPLFRYDVSVKGIVNDGKAKPRELAGGGKNDFFYLQRRDVCYHVFYRLASNYAEFSDFFAFIYDKAKILYSLNQLPALKNPYKVQLDESERQSLRVEERISFFEVSVTECTQDFSCILGNFEAAIDRDLMKRDRSAIQMLELATSQGIYYNLGHLSYGNTHFPKNAAETNDRLLGREREMIKGISKNIRPIEGKNGGAPRAVMQLDIKTGVFWKEQSVLDLAASITNARLNYNSDFTHYQRDKFSDIIKDLVVETTYGTRRQFTVAGLSHKSARDMTLRLDGGQETTLVQYFGQKYGAKIHYGRLPCLKEFRQKDRSFSFYPMELCRLMPGQRIEVMKQSEDQMKFVVPKSALPPSKRWPEIERLSGGVFESPFLDQLNIQVSVRPLDVFGRVLNFPKIECKVQGRTKEVQISGKADWTPEPGTKFFFPGRIVKWGVALLKNPDGSNPCDSKDINTFLSLFTREAANRGMALQGHSFIDLIMPEQVEKYGDHCGQQGATFMIFVTQRKNNQPLHDKMKQYFEEVKGILTQQLVVERTIGPIVQRGRGWNNLLQNVLFKTNTKVGGLNYSINVPGILKPGRMFVSYDVSHPTHLKPHMQDQVPSTVGLCTNSGKHPLMLTGNYGYQRMRREECGDILKHLLISQLKIWLANHDKRAPTELIVLRDGISEGQYLKVIDQELPQLMAAFDELGLSQPAVELFTVEKRHNARFKPKTINPTDKPAFQNVRPGTVIDQDVVHAEHDEFYMCTHVAIQGTAKIPRYGKLCAQIGLSKDELQEILFGLAFNHQIITTPVSLPATLYGAHELAKRGKNTRKAKLSRDDVSDSGSLSSDSGVASSSESASDPEDDVQSFRLGIQSSSLQQIKFWA